MAVYNEKNKSKWTKDGRHWYYVKNYKDNLGKTKYYKSKMFLTRKEAEYDENIFINKNNYSTLAKFNIVGIKYFEEYQKKRKESSYESYLYAYNKHILPYFNDYYINNINIPIIKNWMLEVEKQGYSVNYLNKLYNILKNIFNYAMINYNLESNLLSVIGRFETKNDKIVQDKDKLRYITLNQFNQFISYVDDPLWNTFFYFLFYTGCRKGEVLALKWTDIDFNDKMILINKTLYYKHSKGTETSTKTGQNRKIKMSKTLEQKLKYYKELAMNYADFNNSWYIFGNSRFLAPATIDRKKHEYFEKADMLENEITIHEFRHSHVSLLINEYVKNSKEKNMKVDATKFFLMMSDRMGHTVEVMRKTYLHLLPSVQDEIVDLLDNL